MPNYRLSDPETSRDAAHSVRNLRATQQVVLNILAAGKATDEVIGYVHERLVDYGRADKASPSGLRSRRAELVDLGLVEDSGERWLISTGRRAIVWQITHLGMTYKERNNVVV